MRSPAVLLAAAGALVLVACGSTSTSSTSTPTGSGGTKRVATQNRLATQRVPGIGAVLVSGSGRTLYVFLAEKGGQIKCVGQCAATWPPLLVRSGSKPAITSAVHPNLVGTLHNPSGGAVVTYAGWPLHAYAADARHGTHLGQGKGGQWYMISPSGPIITKPVGSGNTSTSGGSGVGY